MDDKYFFYNVNDYFYDENFLYKKYMISLNYDQFKNITKCKRGVTYKKNYKTI